MIEATRTVIENFFSAERVDFLMIDKELISHFANDKGKSLSLYHAYQKFEVAIPKTFDSKKSNFIVKPAFDRIVDVRNKLHIDYDGKTCVWAVMNPSDSSKLLLFIQIRLGKESKNTFKLIERNDWRSFDVNKNSKRQTMRYQISPKQAT